MKRKITIQLVSAVLALPLVAAQPAHELVAQPVSKPVRGRENIEWSTTYGYHLADAKSGLPRVLLVGDSICSQYQSLVMKLLDGKVNVTYWVSSHCVTSDLYPDMLDVMLKKDKYDVIHFNNGLHTAPNRTTVAQYEAAMERAMRRIRERQPQAKLIWCSSTPLKNYAKGDKTSWVAKLNAAGARAAAKIPGVATDDLFALMDPLDRAEFWSDTYHHKTPAREKEARQVAAMILDAVAK